MKKLLEILESASVELGHLTEPPWCAYTECVARVRDEVRAALVAEKADSQRLDHLEAAMKACPSFDLGHDDIEDSDSFCMRTTGCDDVLHTADSLRELLDQSISFEESGEDFEVWHADYFGDPRIPSHGVAP